MKFYGDAVFQTASSAVLNSEQSFPESPTAGRVVFVDKRVWIAAEIVSGRPIWVPLTNEIDTHTHNQSSSSATWDNHA